MSPNKMSGKTTWIISLIVAVLTILVIILFATQIMGKQKQSITLPSATVEVPAEGEPEVRDQDDFLDVTSENVLTALQSINRPTSYHQTYLISVGFDETQISKTVELWKNGSLLRAETADGLRTRILISNGSTAYLWYEGSMSVISAQLSEELSEEDLLNLPDFDSFIDLQEEQVIDSDYLVLEDSQVQCIYICVQEENGNIARHWISLETGLLYQSDVLENSNQVYSVRQSQYELLAAEDEVFSNCFILPDGSDPFQAAE